MSGQGAPVKSPGLRALDYARPDIGIHETPAGSNDGPEIRKWLKAAGITRPAPWCMAWLKAKFAQAGVQLRGGASVGNFEQWAVDSAEVMLVKRPFAGDIVCYRFDADDWPDHVAIVEKVLALKKGGRPYWIQTIEGNTSSGILGSQANGGGVYRRRRWAARCKFVRVK